MVFYLVFNGKPVITAACLALGSFVSIGGGVLLARACEFVLQHIRFEPGNCSASEDC